MYIIVVGGGVAKIGSIFLRRILALIWPGSSYQAGVILDVYLIILAFFLQKGNQHSLQLSHAPRLY